MQRDRCNTLQQMASMRGREAVVYLSIAHAFHPTVHPGGRLSRTRHHRLAMLACAATVLASAAGSRAGQQPDRARSVLDGIYTQEQAARGRSAYMENCARCHRDDLRGNPEAMPLTGSRFIDTWREDSLFSLFDHIATRMPREPRVTLPTPVYVDILAFILQFNGYPSGGQELTADNLRAVTFVDKVGPQPLPNLAVVRVVGCLTQSAEGTWSLTHATEPVRDPDGRTTTVDQLRASAGEAPGDRSFALANVEYVGDAFMPERHVGERVQAKGALVRRQSDERISVTSLQPVATSCP